MATRPKTGGRQAGTPNKATAGVRALAGSYTSAALATLAAIMTDDTAPPAARVSAANALLDRGHGKPRQQLEHAGNEKEPLTVILREIVRPPGY